MAQSGDNDNPSLHPSPYLVTVADDYRKEQRHFSPSAERNIRPILDVLTPHLPAAGTLLEVASGTGQHCVAYATEFPHLTLQPSDIDPAARASIEAWRQTAALDNILPPLVVDLMADDWHQAVRPSIAGILASNILHISPWAVTLSLISGAARLLPEGGLLFVYGCFSRDGDMVSESNAEFRQEPARPRSGLGGARHDCRRCGGPRCRICRGCGDPDAGKQYGDGLAPPLGWLSQGSVCQADYPA